VIQLAFFAGGAFVLDYWAELPPFRILLIVAARGFCGWRRLSRRPFMG